MAATEASAPGGGRWNEWLQRCRESRSLVLVIVAIALLLDNMLLTTVGKFLDFLTLLLFFLITAHYKQKVTITSGLNFNK